jgi:hypothetical protein
MRCSSSVLTISEVVLQTAHIRNASKSSFGHEKIGNQAARQNFEKALSKKLTGPECESDA